MSDGHGPDLGAIAANTAHTQQRHDVPSAISTSTDLGLNTTQLGQHPIHAPEAIPTFGTPIQIPGGVEGHGALSDTEISLGNSEPLGLPKDAMPGLATITHTGDTNLAGVTPSREFSVAESGLAATSALDSSVGHGGGH